MAGATPSGQQKWTAVGDRRRHITIQQQQSGAATRTSMGFLQNSWTDVLTTWAKVTVRAMTSFAAVSGQEPITKAVFILNIRFPPSIPILNGMHVIDGGNTYLIQNVQDVNELHRELNLFCSQIPAPMAQEQ